MEEKETHTDKFYTPTFVLEEVNRKLLLLLVILTAISMSSVVGRSLSEGWLPVYYPYGVATLSSFCFFFLRNTLSYRVISWYLIGFYISVGMIGVFTFGHLAPTAVMIPTGIALCMFFTDIRTTITLTALTLMVWLTLAGLQISGVLSTQPHNLMSPTLTEWTIRTLLFAWFAANFLIPFQAFMQYYRENFLLLEKQSGELRENEQEFRDLFETVVDCIYRTDLEGRIVNISPSCKDLLGWDADFLIGKKMADFYVDAADREKLLQQLRTSNTESIQFEAKLKNAMGEPQLISSHVKYWRNAAGEVQGVVGVARNIEAQRKAEDQLQLVQKTEALRLVVGGVAHDINNLLAVITAKAESLSHTSENISQQAGEIVRITQQGSGLTKQLLGFSQPGNLNPKSVVVSRVIEDMQEMLRIRAGDSIELQLELSTDKTAIFVDEVQLQTALVNLVVNSRHAMPDGGTICVTASTLHVDETQKDEDIKTVRISVTDTGTGMTPEVKARALEPFYTTKSTGQGFGLGLSVIDNFAKQSGGSLKIESEVGKGTTIHLSLPIIEISGEESWKPEEGKASQHESPDSQSTSVLLIEDREELQRLITRQLSLNKGYSVKIASDGESALSLFDDVGQFDLVLSDITLPGKLTGFDIARRILDRNPEQAIIFMTGYSEHVLDEADELSTYTILRKPFEFSELNNAIQSALARS